MEPLHQPATNLGPVGLKAFRRISEQWGLTPAEAARLANHPLPERPCAPASKLSDELTEDQTLRLSALVGLYASLEAYFGPSAGRWLRLVNKSREFGDRSPLEFMMQGGLPAILRVRLHVDALLAGM